MSDLDNTTLSSDDSFYKDHDTPFTREHDPRTTNILFRRILRQLYEKRDKKDDDVFKKEERIKRVIIRRKAYKNPIVRFLEYASRDHGNILSFLLFLPLIIMTVYILYFERSSLYMD